MYYIYGNIRAIPSHRVYSLYVKEKMLYELIAGKIGFSEAEDESKKCKILSTVKDAFLKEVQLKSWEEAWERVVAKKCSHPSM